MEELKRYYENVVFDNKLREAPKGIMKLVFFIRTLFVCIDYNREKMACLLLPEHSDILLDYGCNNGDFLRKNSDRFRLGYGVDISQRSIAAAKEKLKGLNVRLVAGNIVEKNLDLPYGKVSTIVCSDVIEHMFSPEDLIKKFNALLARGGILILITPNIAFILYRLLLLFGQRPRTSYAPGWDGGHICYFTFRDLIRLMTANGFKIKKKTCGGIFRSFRSWWPSLLGPNIVLVAEKC